MKVGDRVWIVFHTYPNGHQIDVYRLEVDALKQAAEIAVEYATQGEFDTETNSRIIEAVRENEYELALSILDDYVQDNGWDDCNIEVFSTLLQGSAE
ncbi:MAG: hypothetical protein MN733_40850 [Nitrososphaera sp.]|nr:hypothetical protein [Nitrososphaera sp.]